MNDDTNQRARDCGRFADYSDADLLGQLRMEARGQLDPEYCQFLWAVAARFKALTSAREEALEKVLDGIARLIEQVKNRLDTDEYLDGLEDAKGVVLSLITGGGGPCSR